MKKVLVLCLLACLTGVMVAQDAPAAPASDTPAPAAKPDPAAAPVPASAPASGAPAEDSKATDRVKAAATVLDEIQNAGDQRIPEEVLGSAECVAVVPSMLKAGFIVGARYGRGLASCRTAKGWSAPAFFTIGGGSFGLQIGGQAVDLVMLIMNKNGMNNLLASKFKIGADASAAAGPVGRHASADTDWRCAPKS